MWLRLNLLLPFPGGCLVRLRPFKLQHHHVFAVDIPLSIRPEPKTFVQPDSRPVFRIHTQVQRAAGVGLPDPTDEPGQKRGGETLALIPCIDEQTVQPHPAPRRFILPKAIHRKSHGCLFQAQEHRAPTGDLSRLHKAFMHRFDKAFLS